MSRLKESQSGMIRLPWMQFRIKVWVLTSDVWNLGSFGWIPFFSSMSVIASWSNSSKTPNTSWADGLFDCFRRRSFRTEVLVFGSVDFASVFGVFYFGGANFSLSLTLSKTKVDFSSFNSEYSVDSDGAFILLYSSSKCESIWPWF